MQKLAIYVGGFLLVLLLIAALYTNANAASNDIVLTGRDVVKVYDGDTLFVNIAGVHPVFGKRIGVRISNVDTPEMRSKCKAEAAQDRERAMAADARQVLINMIQPNSTVVLSKVKRDKFFRINAVVIVDGVSVADVLHRTGLAVPYDGGRKVSWCK